MKALLIIIMLLSMIISVYLIGAIADLNIEYVKLKQDNEQQRKQIERLSKDRSEVKRILHNDTTLAMYY